jgi:signal transduction histidine kinase/integral membrane sensor domain MASE1
MIKSLRKLALRNPYRAVFNVLFLAVAYYIAGKLSLLLAIPPGYTAPVWPPAGIALVGILHFGYRAWPGVLIGVLMINLGLVTQGHGANSLLLPILLGGSVGMGAAAQALAGAFLVRRYAGFPNPLVNGRQVVSFVLLAGPAACLISATWGVASLYSAGVIEYASVAPNWAAWWVGDTMGVVCMAPVLLVWLAEPRELWASRRAQVTVPLCIALVIVVAFVIYANDQETRRIKSEFEQSADNLTRILQDKIGGYLATLDSLSNFYAASPGFTRNEFETYVSGLLARNPGIQRLSWNPVVTDPERKRFKEAARREGYENFEIRELNPQGQLVRAAKRRQYVPVYFVAPHKENEFAVGYDLAAVPLNADGLRRACDEGRAGATSPIKLLGETQDEWGVVLFLPIYRPGSPHDTVEARRRNIYGYFGGAFRLPDLMATSVALVREPGVQLEIWDGERNLKLIQRYPATALGKRVSAPTTLRKSGTVAVANRSWRLQFYPTAEFIALQRSWQVWSVLFGGLLFAGVLGAFLLVVSGHAAATERLVQERTAELEKANKERADFTAMIVHDLRVPLQVIRGVAQAIGTESLGPLNDEQRDWLARIDDNTKHMTDIVGHFLDVSKLEATGFDLVRTQVDLKKLTTTCIRNVRPLAEKKNLLLKNTCADGLPKINADAGWLEQVLWNLLSNAIKFTHNGGEITVGCEQVNGNLTTWVKDTGVGISPAALRGLFRKYHQAENHKSTGEKGTGLGLVICKMIVDAHRGKIWVDSEQNKGSTFYFSLPIDGG